MKNIIILGLLVLFVNAKAQEPTASTTASGPVSKSGVAILPAAGDFAIGIDALPYINFLGNMFNNTDGQSLYPNSTNLYLRYHLSETDAVRLIVSISDYASISREYVQDDAARFADPLSQAQVEDKSTHFHSSISFDLAYQKSRGYGKLRGLYGVNVNVSYSNDSYEYQYGNNFTAANTSPTTAYDGRTDVRDIEQVNGSNTGIGIGLLGGVEYYFMPKACIGFEIDLGYGASWNGQGSRKTEQYNGSSVVEMDKPFSPSGLNYRGMFTSRVTNYNGLYVMFHF
jgi:hypothetical protein